MAGYRRKQVYTIMYDIINTEDIYDECQVCDELEDRMVFLRKADAIAYILKEYPHARLLTGDEKSEKESTIEYDVSTGDVWKKYMKVVRMKIM